MKTRDAKELEIIRRIVRLLEPDEVDKSLDGRIPKESIEDIKEAIKDDSPRKS